MKQSIKLFFIVQLVFLTIGACLLDLTLGQKTAISWILGGLINVIPQAIFAEFLFHFQGAKKAKKIAKCFYWGETAKLISTIVMFGSVFKWFNIVPSALFISFVLMQGVVWFSPWIVKNDIK